MYAQYYERKRGNWETSTPTIERIFGHKGEAAAKNQAVKKLFITTEELDQVRNELLALREKLKTYKATSEVEEIAKIFGVPLEVLNELGYGKVNMSA